MKCKACLISESYGAKRGVRKSLRPRCLGGMQGEMQGRHRSHTCLITRWKAKLLPSSVSIRKKPKPSIWLDAKS